MEMSVTQRDGVAVVQLLDDRLDAAIAVQFKDAIRREVDGWDGPVVLDMKSVNFMDSSGLGAVVAVMKLLGQRDRLHLARLQPMVDKVLRLTRMDRVFSIHDTIGAAIEASQNDKAA